MNLLLVHSERAQREPLAAYLRGRGHAVHTAGCIDEGLRALRTSGFDAVVTTWRIGDEDASALIASAHGPCVVIGAGPDEVVDHPAIAAVLVAPVAPGRIATVLAELDVGHGAVADPTTPLLERLPIDTRDRVRAVLAILDEPRSARVVDDGVHVTIEGRLSAPERWVGLLDGIGGDLRVLSETDEEDEDAPLRLLLRLDRHGLPAGIETSVAPGDPWPDDPAFAIDFDARTVAPDRFLALCDQVRRAVRHGREIHLVNVPPHLRICLEAVGRADDLPIRRASGPRLPGVLGELWR